MHLVRIATFVVALFVVREALAAKRVDVRFVPDEARAVLVILDKRAAKKPIPKRDWQRLFASEGYVRLKKREHSMQREFEDEAFRTFVMSDELLAKRAMLHATLREWLSADISGAANRALAYLPADATIRAKVYPVIKPRSNSFVFEVETDPAIFQYVDAQPRARFEQTIAHEMHHVGYGTSCRSSEEELPDNLRDARKWLSAFGEGIATLAAAGGPDADAQLVAEENVHVEWTSQLARLEPNFHELDAFFTDVLDGKLTGEAQSKRAFEFFGLVGPWYTVGWKMGVVIEKTLGREALIEAMCDRRRLLATYNRAAAEWTRRTGEQLPQWSPRVAGMFDR